MSEARLADGGRYEALSWVLFYKHDERHRRRSEIASTASLMKIFIITNAEIHNEAISHFIL